MNSTKPVCTTRLMPVVIISAFLCLYLAMGIYTELRLAELKPIPDSLLEDFTGYEFALNEALQGNNPYASKFIGTSFLYPPPSLFIIEIFHLIEPLLLKISLFATCNIALMIAMVFGIARYYGLTAAQAWYWYVLCLGFGPFFEVLHIGQINVITLFGIFMMFIWADSAPLLSGLSLSLAVITKVSPLLFFGYLLVNKRVKLVACCCASLAALLCAGAMRYGPTPILEYPKRFQLLIQQFPVDARSHSQSLIAVFSIQNFNKITGTVSDGVGQSPVKFLCSFISAHYQAAHKVLVGYILLVILISALVSAFGRQPREPSFIITALGMTLSPNVMWYHHYVFMLLPILVWIGWSRHDRRVVAWCLFGLLIIQIDRLNLTNGMLIHAYGHASILMVLAWQIYRFCNSAKTAGALK